VTFGLLRGSERDRRGDVPTAVEERAFGERGARTFGVKHLPVTRREIWRTSTRPAAIMRRPRQGSPSSKRASPRPNRHGAAVEAHSPLGHGQARLLDDPVIRRRIAAARDKTSAQIVLRWHLQHGRIVFPKAVHRERMEENLKAFGFELSPDEIAAIDSLDRVRKDASGRIRARSP
jgi:Aldo/keto reductase family